MYDLDCGSNSCKYVPVKTGMRTNGRCNCADNKPKLVERFLMNNYLKAQEKILKLQTDLEMEKMLDATIPTNG